MKNATPEPTLIVYAPSLFFLLLSPRWPVFILSCLWSDSWNDALCVDLLPLNVLWD